MPDLGDPCQFWGSPPKDKVCETWVCEGLFQQVGTWVPIGDILTYTCKHTYFSDNHINPLKTVALGFSWWG